MGFTRGLVPQRLQIVAVLAFAAFFSAEAVEQKIQWTVEGAGSSALRDYISDGVGNATQDANLGGLYLPFYTYGTGTGQAQFLNATYDYSIGDGQLNATQYNTSGRPIVQFPLALGSVSFFYNLPGFLPPNNTLRLNASVASNIFNGNITTWDHPDILAINPNITNNQTFLSSITNKTITVVVRTDSVAGSGVVSKWLNASGNGTWGLNVGQTIVWNANLPNFLYTIGGSNLTGLVANHTFSICYTDTYAGSKAKLFDAQIRNKNGTWLKYSSADYNFTDLGDSNITWPSSPDQDWSAFSVVNLNGNKTWPIPTVAFAATNIDLRDKGDRGAAQKQMFGYLLGPTVGGLAKFYKEVPLPELFLNYSIWGTKLIKTKSKLIFYEPNQLPVALNYSNAFSAY